MLRPLTNDVLPLPLQRSSIHDLEQVHPSATPLPGDPSTSDPQPRVTVSSPGAGLESLVPVMRMHLPHSRLRPPNQLDRSEAQYLYSTSLRLQASTSQSILDSGHKSPDDFFTTANEDSLENMFLFEHNRIKAERDIAIASGNVSQLGDGNIHANNVYIQHGPSEDEHQNALRYIRGKLQSYLVAEATLNKDIHDEPSVCYEGTRKTLLKQVLSWVAATPAARNPKASGRAKCIVGAPGSGKSTIMNTLIIELLEDAARRSPGLIAAHYCIRRSVHSTTDGSKVLPTLILQLADRDATVATRVYESLRSHPQTGILAPKFLETLFIRTIQSHQQTVFLIIDALDEASDPASLAATLARVIPDAPLNLRLLLATRNENGVLHSLGEALIPEIVHQIPTEESVDEVAGYITHRLRNGIRAIFGDNPDWRYWPHDSQLRSLFKKAGGLFIWARTAVDYILSRIQTHGAANRDRWIEDVEGLGMADVNSLYMLILEKLLQSKEGDSYGGDMRRIRITGVFGFINVAKHPFPLDDLVEFLGFRPDFDVTHFVNMARSILVPGTEPITGSTIPTMHKTFFDFVTTERASLFRVDLKDHHTQAAHRCFALMETRLCFNIFGLSSSFELHDTSTLAARVPRGLLYASTRWWYHIQQGNSPMLPSHLDSIQALFFDKFLFWLEVVSLDDETFEAAQSCLSDLLEQLRSRTISSRKSWIPRMRMWISRRLFQTTLEDGSGLAAFAEEALLLMDKFGYCILKSVPHIYVSLLAFSPADSVVAHHYRKKVSTMIIPLSDGFPSQWISWGNDPRPDYEDGNLFIQPISFSPCSLRLAVGYEDNRIRVWDVETGQCVIGPLEGHSNTINSVCFSPNGLLIASGSDDTTIRVWDAETGKCILGPLMGHTRSVLSVAFSPDSTRVASGSADDTVRFWDVRSGSCVLGPLKGPTRGSDFISYFPDGSCIASGYSSYPPVIRLWNARTGECVCGPLSGYRGMIWSLSFHPDGRRLVTACEYGFLRIWDYRKGICTHGPLAGHDSTVWSVCFSPDGRYIASGSSDGTIRIWDAETALCVAGPFGGASSAVTSVAFSPDEKHLAAGSWDGAVRLWDFKALLNTGLRDSAREDEASAKTTRMEITDHTAVERAAWTLGPNGEKLFWTPHPFTAAIWRPSTVRILGRPAMIEPDLSSLVTGEEWLQSFPSS